MTRARTRNHELPPRVYLEDGRYRYHAKDGKKHPLGREFASAMAKHALLTQAGNGFDPISPSALAELYRRHRKGALQRGILFDVSAEAIEALMRAQEGRCAVTSLAFNDIKPQGLRIRPWLPSLDRIDSRQGYQPGNLRIVCGFVNVALNGFGNEFFNVVLEPLIRAAVDAAEARRECRVFPIGNTSGLESKTA